MEATRASADCRSWWRRPRPVAIVFGEGIPVLLLLAFLIHYSDWPASPDPLPVELQSVAADWPGSIGTAHVYDFWGNFIDSQHLWRVEVRPDVLPVVVKRLGVVELDAGTNLPPEFWRQPPYWWRPQRTGRFFLSPKFPVAGRGPDGIYYAVAFDESAGVLYVWLKNNF